LNDKIDLKEIERKAWTSYFEDGLWDIFLGLMMLTMGIRSLTDNVWFTLGFLPAILISVLGKKYITIPRIGVVKFGPARQARRQRLVIVLAILVLATFALVLLPNLGLELPTIPISPIMAIYIAVAFGVLAHYMTFGRLYVYGAMLAITELLWGLYGQSIGSVAQTVSGVAALSLGLAVFIRFIGRYPEPRGDELDD
jgi:hypothetical protein